MNRSFSSSFVRAGVVATALVALPTVFGARPASAQNLFVAGSGRQFGVLNAQTGAYSFIGTTSITLAGLGVGSDGIVYAIDTSANTQLYRVNTTTATLTSVGTLGAFNAPPGNYSLGLTSTSDGTLYAYFSTGANNNSLYTVNRTNAATTLVGSTNQRFDGGLGGDGSGGLFATSGDTASAANTLFSLNRTTGAASALPTTNAAYSQTFALGYTTGAFFGFGFGGGIYTINQATGAAAQTATYNTATAGNIFAATTFVTTSGSLAPEPGTLPLFGMGLAGGLGIVARRHKHGKRAAK